MQGGKLARELSPYFRPASVRGRGCLAWASWTHLVSDNGNGSSASFCDGDGTHMGRMSTELSHFSCRPEPPGPMAVTMETQNRHSVP